MRTELDKQIELAVAHKGDLICEDAGFAIAYAILRLAEAQEATASALRALGTGNAATEMGAIEALSVSVEALSSSIREGMSDVARAISDND